MKAPETGTVITVAYLLGFVIILFIVYKLMTKLGLIKSAAKKKEEKIEAAASKDLRAMKFFDTGYLKGKNYKSIGTAKETAASIRNALKGLGTDEEKIFSAFSKLPSKDSISEVALNYAVDYKSSMITDLLNELTDEEKVTLVNIINDLP
jgi:hypothetical protein